MTEEKSQKFTCKVRRGLTWVSTVSSDRACARQTGSRRWPHPGHDRRAAVGHRGRAAVDCAEQGRSEWVRVTGARSAESSTRVRLASPARRIQRRRKQEPQRRRRKPKPDGRSTGPRSPRRKTRALSFEAQACAASTAQAAQATYPTAPLDPAVLSLAIAGFGAAPSATTRLPAAAEVAAADLHARRALSLLRTAAVLQLEPARSRVDDDMLLVHGARRVGQSARLALHARRAVHHAHARRARRAQGSRIGVDFSGTVEAVGKGVRFKRRRRSLRSACGAAPAPISRASACANRSLAAAAFRSPRSPRCRRCATRDISRPGRRC